jgi:hypothetical protein
MFMFMFLLHIHQVGYAICLRLRDGRGEFHWRGRCSWHASKSRSSRRSGFGRVFHSKITQIQVDSLVEQNIAGSRWVITEVSEDVFFVNRLDVLIVAHDPSASGANHGDIMSMVWATDSSVF